VSGVPRTRLPFWHLSKRSFIRYPYWWKDEPGGCLKTATSEIKECLKLSPFTKTWGASIFYSIQINLCSPRLLEVFMVRNNDRWRQLHIFRRERVFPSPHSLLPSTILSFHKVAPLSPFSTLLHLTMHLSEVEVHRRSTSLSVEYSTWKNFWRTLHASPSSRVAAVVVACKILRLALGGLTLVTMIEAYLSISLFMVCSRIERNILDPGSMSFGVG
jgi:hypothetical protein